MEPVQPAPPGWGAPSPPGVSGRPRRRRRWPWVLGAVLGAIVILAISGTVLFVQKIKPPIDAANDFLSAAEAGNFDAAFNELCAADQEEFTPDGLEVLFGLGGDLLEDFSINPFDVDIDGDRATVTFDSDGLDDNEVVEVPLRKEDGDWRVCLSDDPTFVDLGGGLR